MVSSITFRSSSTSSLFLFVFYFLVVHVRCSVFWAPLLAETGLFFFFHCMLLPPLFRLIYRRGLGWSPVFLSHFTCVSIFVPVLFSLYYCSSVFGWCQGAWFLQLRISCSEFLWQFSVFCVFIQILKILFQFCEKSHW